MELPGQSTRKVMVNMGDQGQLEGWGGGIRIGEIALRPSGRDSRLALGFVLL